VVEVARASRGGAVQIVEGEHMLVGMRHPCIGDRRPTITDVDAFEFEPPQNV
jgi:hypothetical protein